VALAVWMVAAGYAVLRNRPQRSGRAWTRPWKSGRMRFAARERFPRRPHCRSSESEAALPQRFRLHRRKTRRCSLT
jgi:hypothetical protein